MEVAETNLFLVEKIRNAAHHLHQNSDSCPSGRLIYRKVLLRSGSLQNQALRVHFDAGRVPLQFIFPVRYFQVKEDQKQKKVA